jgi:glycosyltransferase involved in cell wall biosynthesis
VKVMLVPSWYPTPGDPVRGHFFVRQLEALQLEHDVLLVSPPRGSSLPAFTVQVARAMRVARPDVVHAHVAVPAGVASLAGRLATRVPVVLTEHSGPLDRLYGNSRLRRRGVAAVFEEVDALAVPSPTLERELRQLGVRRPLEVIPNPVADHGEASPEPFLFVSVGLMDDRTKGFDHLLPAWNEVAAKRPEARLRIVGDGALRSEYQRLAAEVERVTFVGALAPEATVEEMRHADAYVFASVWETFGIALAEAATLGTPAVATTVGIAPQLLDASTGVLVPPGDAGALARGILEFCERRESFDRTALRRQALELFAPEAVCRQTTAVYERVLGGRR